MKQYYMSLTIFMAGEINKFSRLMYFNRYWAIAFYPLVIFEWWSVASNDNMVLACINLLSSALLFWDLIIQSCMHPPEVRKFPFNKEESYIEAELS